MKLYSYFIQLNTSYFNVLESVWVSKIVIFFFNLQAFDFVIHIVEMSQCVILGQSHMLHKAINSTSQRLCLGVFLSLPQHVQVCSTVLRIVLKTAHQTVCS